MKVTLFSNNCPRCYVLKTKLDEKEIPYTVSYNFKLLECLGIDILPVLMVDDKIYSEFREAVYWVNNQRRNNG